MAPRSRRASMFLRLLAFELEKFQEYRSSVTGSLAADLDRIGERGDALPPEEQEDFYDRMYDEIALVRDEFPPLLRSTTYIALYSVLEHRLRRVCDLLKRGEFRKFKGKPRESYLDRARRFIEEKCERPFPGTSPEWCMLNGHYRVVRNCLVHEAGEVRDNKAVLSAVATLKGIELTDRGEIVLEDGCLDGFSGSIRAFFDDLATMVL